MRHADLSRVRPGEPRQFPLLRNVRRRARPGGRAPARGAEGRDDPLHRPRRLDRTRGRARPGGRAARRSRRTTRSSATARAARRHRREVHRRRRDGRLRRAGRARGRRRARGPRRARHPRLDRRRAPDPHRRQHGRGTRRPRSEARRGRRDGGGRRRQHGRAAAERSAGQRDPRRRGDVPRHPGRRSTTATRRPVEAKGKAEPVTVWEARRRPLALRQRRRADAADAARRPRAGARPPRRRSRTGAHASSRRSWSRSSACRASARAASSPSSFQILETDPDLICWRQGRSLPYGERVSVWALGEIVKAHAGILESDDAATVEEKLDAMVETLAEDDGERDWVVRHTRPPRRPRGHGDAPSATEAFAAWRRLIEAAAEQRTLVLVFEDLHWADDGAARLRRQPRRVGDDGPAAHRRHGPAGAARPAARLGRRQAERLHALDRRAQRRGDGRFSCERLLDRPVLDADDAAGGAAARRGQPALRRGVRADARRARRRRPPAPRNGAGSDRGAHRRACARGESPAAGRVGHRQGLLAGCGRPAADDRSVHALERKEFVRRDRRSSIAGETQYAFLHALVRDVAYGQIPRAERAEKHRRAAEWLASLAGDRAEDHAEMLAHHYREALALAEAAGVDGTSLREPARRAFTEAAQRALSLNASAAAYELAQEALALTEPGDAQAAGAPAPRRLRGT